MRKYARVGDKKKINGKIFTLHDYTLNKGEAERIKEKLKNKGWLVRIIQVGRHHVWDIWKRKKI